MLAHRLVSNSVVDDALAVVLARLCHVLDVDIKEAFLESCSAARRCRSCTMSVTIVRCTVRIGRTYCTKPLLYVPSTISSIAPITTTIGSMVSTIGAREASLHSVHYMPDLLSESTAQQFSAIQGSLCSSRWSIWTTAVTSAKLRTTALSASATDPCDTEPYFVCSTGQTTPIRHAAQLGSLSRGDPRLTWYRHDA
ncbi:hypothetical protein PYCCODRAFT_394712 [Trametes coccinea BRFM310]|uniref:Uncharacterized protein n=1 Tax=Trametes coccinea (strain BRFM310) TaxID=1353009 RepID=A0A1Y2J496_TRAC3|nr:hypothetical protein PYCCODRAFT_394712 [Trametes coccinea BRFM310]